jgi:hypothetical protein
MFLKTVMRTSNYAPTRLAYVPAGTTVFNENINKTYNLPESTPYQRVLTERREKAIAISEDFYRMDTIFERRRPLPRHRSTSVPAVLKERLFPLSLSSHVRDTSLSLTHSLPVCGPLPSTIGWD